MSQAELARRVGLKQSTINGLIKGDQRTSGQFHRIASELQTTPEYLTGQTDDPSMATDQIGYSPNDREWIDVLKALTPRDRSIVLQLARMLAGPSAKDAAIKSDLLEIPVLQSPKVAFRGAKA